MVRICDLFYGHLICFLTENLLRYLDFSSIWPFQLRKAARADVLNGISVSEDPEILYVTGKNWDRMYRVRLKY